MIRRVVITDTDLGDGTIEASILGPHVDLCVASARSEEDVISVAADADGLLVQWAPISDRVLAALPTLRAVVRYGVGLDNVDVAAAGKRGIKVSNVPDYCIDEVAEHTFALVLAGARRLSDLDRQTHHGAWGPKLAILPLPTYMDPVGIAGFGRIGLAVSERLSAAGFPVFAFDPYQRESAFAGVQRVGSLVELAEVVNHLCLQLPGGSDTAGICGAEVLSALGPDGHLVNTARGSLVDELALIEALDAGRLWRASLDVLANEPPEGTSALLAAHPRVLCTPHVAYQSSMSGPKLQQHAAHRMRELLELG